MAQKSKFIQDLPKIYGIYTLGFLGFFALMAFFETQGMGAKTIGILFVSFTILIYAIIGWLSRTAQVEAYYLAGRQVPTVFNGMATAADWMSGASFVAMAGGIYFGGYTYMAFLVGWTGGYVLVSSLMAPYLRKFCCYTVPDFIGTRYGGNFARFCAVLVLLIASFTYVTAQINATGTIASRALAVPFEVGVWVGLISILLCSMLGGMRSVTWSQVAQYIVLIIAYLIPVFWMSWKLGHIFPHISMGGTVEKIAALEAQYGLIKNSPDVLKAAGVPAGLSSMSTPHSGVPAGAMAAWKYISLAICMMVGTASLPHILMRYFTTPSVTSARRSVGWSLFFIFLLYFSAPMLATLSKIQLLDPTLPTAIIGSPYIVLKKSKLKYRLSTSCVIYFFITSSLTKGIPSHISTFISQKNTHSCQGSNFKRSTNERQGIPSLYFQSLILQRLLRLLLYLPGSTQHHHKGNV